MPRLSISCGLRIPLLGLYSPWCQCCQVCFDHVGFHLPSSQSASCVTLYLISGHLAFFCSKCNSIQQHLSALRSSRSVRCMQITMLLQLLPPNQEPGTDSFSSNHLSSRTFSDREHTYTWTVTSSNMPHLESGKKAQIQNQKSSIKCRKKYCISAIFFVQTFEQTFAWSGICCCSRFWKICYKRGKVSVGPLSSSGHMRLVALNPAFLQIGTLARQLLDSIFKKHTLRSY